MRSFAAAGPSGGRRFSAVLIDFYGTLAPIGRGANRAGSVREMAGILEVDADRLVERWFATFPLRTRGALGSLEETVRTLAGEVGGRPSAAQVERAVSARLRFSQESVPTSPALLATLDELRAGGLRLALVSNASEELPRVWPGLPVAARLDVAVFSCVERLAKPDPRIYRVALDRLGVPATAAAFVGDGGNGELKGAQRVGLTPFLFRYPFEAPGADRVSEAEVDWPEPPLADLRDLLR